MGDAGNGGSSLPQPGSSPPVTEDKKSDFTAVASGCLGKLGGARNNLIQLTMVKPFGRSSALNCFYPRPNSLGGSPRTAGSAARFAFPPARPYPAGAGPRPARVGYAPRACWRVFY